MALLLPLSALQTTAYPSYANLPEEEVWEDWRQGDETALIYLHKIYYRRLFQYGIKLAHDAALSEDCIQDLFATLWASRQQISAVHSVKFYLFSSYRRLVLQHIKKQQKALARLLNQEPDMVFSAEEIKVRSEADTETARNLVILLNSLPKRQKEALYLRYYEELSFTEVAQLMNLNYQSVLNHIQRALQNIRQRPDLAAFLGRSLVKVAS